MFITKQATYRLVLSWLFVTILGIPLQAQQAKYQLPSGYTTSQKTNTNIVPGVILTKLKPEFRHYTNNLAALKRNKILTPYLQQFEITRFEKLTPEATPPTEARNKQGIEMVDLSLIHIIHFNSTQPMQDLINGLIATGLVEYAEPQYIDQVLYIPSDTLADPDKAQGLLLKRINAYKAWEVEKGDTNVVIGILDTGTELNHPDLAANIKYNWADPINGVDDDGDGYTDNFYGWDVGSNDNNPSWQVADHGVRVHGSSSATPDNVAGIAGTGFNCKSLPIKISNSSGSLVAGYAGISYAANHGVKVMNLSWGGYGSYSQTNQNYINYAAINKDVLIIAAAGNTEGELDFYPASYDNVISVTGLDTLTSPLYDTLYEVRKTFNFGGFGQSYSFNVDLASLEGGYSTRPGGIWQEFGGSSFASPTVAGAAALVRSKFPHLSALQAGEQLRVTGEILDTFDITRPESRYKTGRKLNMYKALTDTTLPSVRMRNLSVKSTFGTDLFNGDTITITNNFYNYLSGTNNLSIELISLNGHVTMLDNTSYLGKIDSLTYKNNLDDPFRFIINHGTPLGQVIDLVMIMRDPTKNYYDFQGFKIFVNPTYLKLDTNQLKTTVTANGRIGYNVYETSPPSQGLGVNYQNNALLYEAGLMIGTSTTKVSDCIRGDFATIDKEFKSVENVHYVKSSLKDQEAYTVFNDSNAASIIGIEVAQRSYAWKNSPNDKFVVLEYQITNQSSATYDSLAAGIFADWDIASYQYNRADWDDARKIAYTYSLEGGTKVAGISLLTDNAPSCYSLDHTSVDEDNINPNDGFTTEEKFRSIAKGVFKKQAGATGFGADVSQVIGAKVYNFAPGDSVTIAFAIIVADNMFELMEVAEQAKNKFVSIKQGPVPVLSDVTICRQDTIDVTLTPTNGNLFAFFQDPPPAAPVHIGSSYTMTEVSQNDTLYIANKDSLFLSDLKTVYIKKDPMMLAYYPGTDTISLPKGSSLLLVNQSYATSSILWDLGDGASETSNYVSHVYDTEGYYTVYLSGTSASECKDTLRRIVKVETLTGLQNSLNGNTLNFYPNPVVNTLTIDFANNKIPDDLSLELINAIGHSVFISEKGSHHTHLDLSAYPSGIYYLKLKSRGSEVSQKIIKN